LTIRFLALLLLAMNKLDSSLEEILHKSRNKNDRRSGRKPAPVGGITKKPRIPATKASNNKSGAAHTESSIVVSNLPGDVDEAQIKDYFHESVSRVKTVEISYASNGNSRGKANVTFHNANGASLAYTKLNGIRVDNRPIDIKIVVGDDKAQSILEESKSLFERTAAPKAQPKSAASDRRNTAAQGKGEHGRNGRRRIRNGRPVKKTVDQLDSEMADYFDAAPANGETVMDHAPAVVGADADAPMEDEIS